MRNLTLPVTGPTLVPKNTSPKTLPDWFQSATGLLDYEAQDLGDRIQLATYNGKPAVKWRLLPGDSSPNWGGSGKRTEMWPIKDQPADYQGTYCMSWVFPDAAQLSGLTWAWVFQYHVGPAFRDADHPDEGGLATGLSVLNGQVGVYHRYQGTKVWEPVRQGRELFAELAYKQAESSGNWDWRLSWDTPPDDDAPVFRPFSGRTLFGTQMYPKTGLYAGSVPHPVEFWQTAYVRRSTLAEALAVAGWDGTAPPPPTVTHSIAEGATLTGNITWTATAPSGPVVFTIDGARSWTENNPPFTYLGDGALFDTTTLADGPHTFAVAAAGVTHSVTATVDNAPDPTPSPLNLTIDTVTATHVYVSWTPVPGAGYRFYVDGAPVSVTMNPDMHTTRFKRTKPSHAFEVRALEYGERDTVTWTSTP